MYRIHNIFFIILYGILYGITAPLLALPSDINQPMHIVSDASSFNYHTGISQYDGHVEITQGTAILHADRVITYNNAQHKIQKAVAYGFQHPAEYWTQLKKNEPQLHAIAQIIQFYPQKSLIFLKGNARVIQGKNTFVGPLAIYNIKKQTVTAPQSSLGRATVIINPDTL